MTTQFEEADKKTEEEEDQTKLLGWNLITEKDVRDRRLAKEAWSIECETAAAPMPS